MLYSALSTSLVLPIRSLFYDRPISVNTTIWYVAATGTNGDGTSPSTPWVGYDNINWTLVLEDHIVEFLDGSYVLDTEKTLTPADNVTLRADNSGMATFTVADASTNIFSLSGTTGLTINGLAFDLETGAKSAINGGSTNSNTTITGCSFINTMEIVLDLQSAFTGCTVNSCTFSGACTDAVYMRGGAANTFTLSNCTANLTNLTASTSTFLKYFPVVDGCRLSLSGNNITMEGANTIHGVYTWGGKSFDVNSNTFDITSSSGLGSAVHALCHGTLITDYCLVRKNNITVDNTAYQIMVGSDGAPATANTINGIAITENKSVGGSHGILVGYSTGAEIARNWIEDTEIGVIIKNSSDCVANHNVSLNATSAAMQSKEATNAKFYHNIATTSVTTGRCIFVDTNNVSAQFTNNICEHHSADYGVYVEAGSAASFSNNLYHNLGSVTKLWRYEATEYTLLADWQTAHEAKAIEADPQLNATYRLPTTSPCLNAGVEITGYTQGITPTSSWPSAVSLETYTCKAIDGSTVITPYTNILPCGVSGIQIGCWSEPTN